MICKHIVSILFILGVVGAAQASELEGMKENLDVNAHLPLTKSVLLNEASSLMENTDYFSACIKRMNTKKGKLYFIFKFTPIPSNVTTYSFSIIGNLKHKLECCKWENDCLQPYDFLIKFHQDEPVFYNNHQSEIQLCAPPVLYLVEEGTNNRAAAQQIQVFFGKPTKPHLKKGQYYKIDFTTSN